MVSKSVEEAWTGARLLVLKVVFGAKTPRKCAKCRGSVAPRSPKTRVQRAVHIAHSNSSRSSKCRGSVVTKKRVQRPVGGTSDGCRRKPYRTISVKVKYVGGADLRNTPPRGLILLTVCCMSSGVRVYKVVRTQW
jgi:hypothetical protein